MSEFRDEPAPQREALVRTVWMGVLGVAIAGPALLWLATAPTQPLWERLSILSGLFALSALACAAVLPSRIRAINRAFGIESVMEVHRFLGVVTAVLVLAHLACVVAADPANVALLDLLAAPARAVAATGATAALVVLVAAAALRQQLRLDYEWWRWMHVLLGATVLVLSALHIWLLDNLMRDAAMRLVFGLLLATVVWVAGYRWIWRTLLDPATEFAVTQVRAESPSVSTLVLEPRGCRHAFTDSWASDIDNPEAVVIRRIGDAVVAGVSGEIDMVTAPLLHPVIEQHAAAAECSLLVVDLGEVGFLASHGLTALLSIRQFAEDRGLPLSIVAAENRHVMRTLEITDLDKVLPICASVDEALSAG